MVILHDPITLKILDPNNTLDPYITMITLHKLYQRIFLSSHHISMEYYYKKVDKKHYSLISVQTERDMLTYLNIY